MIDSESQYGPDASNAHEFTVSELAGALKRTVEDTFGNVRVRGELGRVTVAKSGHCYLDIKDDRSVIASIIWKGVMSQLPVRPEEGMEVIVEGKLTTYPGRSQYQLVISRLEPAGEGAFMALLEKRKKMFAAEGLFDADRKKEIPFLPEVIGVVTSPTGAVIRDILHRLEDRFPRRVLVWPVLVQGDRAAAQISAAITGFNNLPLNGPVPRPDTLIVARGGGSVEDLWPFNEENVVRAASQSRIPLIAAVGHETDWTLIDYVADYRAPTPTGAAERAVPVRSELADYVGDQGLRLKRGLRESVERRQLRLGAAKLPKADSLLADSSQRLDLATARLTPALMQGLNNHGSRFERAALRLRGDALAKDIRQRAERLMETGPRMKRAFDGRYQRLSDRLSRAGSLLEAYSYKGVLERGFALVTDGKGQVVREGGALASGEAVTLTFKDGDRAATIDGTPAKPKPAPKPKTSKKPSGSDKQQSLF